MVFVALYSVSSCFARSLFGELSQQALVRADIPRPAFLAISAGLTATASLVAATGSLPLLYIASMVGGFAFGSYWVLMPAIISEVFGTRFFATIYGFTASSPALGALLLSNLLVARAYDNMGKKHGDPEGTCFGPDCYQSPFLCIAALSTVSIAFSLLVAARARQRYSAIHAWLAGQGM